MTVPDRTDIGNATTEALAGLAEGDPDILAQAQGQHEARESGLDPISFALVKIAALVALDSPPASYVRQVSAAIDAGVTPQEILGVLFAIASEVGSPRVVSAAPEIMLALGLSLPGEDERIIPSASRMPPGTDFGDDDEDDEDDNES